MAAAEQRNLIGTNHNDLIVIIKYFNDVLFLLVFTTIHRLHHIIILETLHVARRSHDYGV